MPDVQRLKNDLLALGLLAFAVVMGLAVVRYSTADRPGESVYPAPAMLQNLCGPTGARLAHVLHSMFGLGAWFLLAAVALFDARLFTRKPVVDPVVRTLGGALMLAAVCGGLQLTLPVLG